MSPPRRRTLPLGDNFFATAAKAGEDAFARQLDACEPSKTCARHAEHTAILNRAASLAALSIIYTCQECVAIEQRQAWNTRQAQAGIPEALRDARIGRDTCTFQTNRPQIQTTLHTPEHFLQCARDWHARRVRNLILSGGVGIGKSHLAAALANQRLWTGQRVLWVDFCHMFDELARIHDKPRPHTRPELLHRYSAPQVLIIDELALRPLTDHESAFLFNLMEARDQANQQTIATTNIPAPDLIKSLGDRVVQRFIAGGHHYCYGMWASMRG